MSSDPQNEKSVLRDEETAWLMQFYTPSKTTILTEFSDVNESEQESPAAQLSTSPAEKYQIAEDLGAGAMKLVRRTLDKNAARDVALAVLLDPAPRSKKISRFVREARITAALEHPNIVPIYDIGVDEAGKPYFTMKLLGGETLHTILQRLAEGNADYKKRYPLSRLLQIFLGVCNAVSFAHSRGVIHLDLKPANIQVGDFGEVLVLDWGLAKVIEKDPAQFPHRLVLGGGLREIPKEGVVRGTPGFMGPEQARGEYASLNEHTDIFSLGAVLYTVLKCKLPSKKSDPAVAAPKDKPVSVIKIPAALEAVVTKAMARQPAHRYASVEELAGDVQAFLDGYATKAQQASALTLLWLLIKRHNVVASLLCLSVALVFSILAVTNISIRHSEKKAVESAKVAEEALDRIKKEQETTQLLSRLAAPRILQKAEYFIHMTDYDQAVSELEYMLAFDSEFQNGGSPANEFQTAWWELGALRLGRQEFEQAVDAFDHVSKAPESNAKNNPPALLDLSQVARKYAAITRENRGVLPRDRQEEFVSDIMHADRTAPPQRQMALGAFFKNQNHSLETANFDLIEKMLRVMNPDAQNLEFSHQSADESLKVSLHGARVSQILPLTGLPITYLDLSNTSGVDLGWVRDMPLVTVDLSGSRTPDFQPLTKITTLTELRLVNTRDRDFTHLRPMTQLKRIVVSKADVMDARRALADRTRTPPEIIGE